MAQSDHERYVQEAASLLWQTGGENVEKTVDCWLAAEKYVQNIALGIGKTGLKSLGFKDVYAHMYETFSPATYQEQIRSLASAMWEGSGRLSDRSLDFWTAAEKHIGTIIQGAIVRAASPLGAAETLQQIFEVFSPQSYLDSLRVHAYYIWEASGRQYGQTLDHWLSGEQSVQDAVAAGGLNFFAFALPPGGPVQRPGPVPKPPGRPNKR